MSAQKEGVHALPYFPVASKWWVCIITFMAYAAYHVARKSFSVIKAVIIQDEFFTSPLYSRDDQSTMCGLLDTIFLAFYAVGLYVSGVLGDVYNPRIVLTIGMMGMAILTALFGIFGLANVHDLSAYAIIWSISGLIQSTGWPANVAVMGNWFGKKKRGAVMGLWSGTISFGNILGTGIVAGTMAIMGDHLGWRWAMVFSGIWVVFFALWVYLQLTPHPSDLGLPDPNHEDATPARKQSELEALIEENLWVREPLITQESEESTASESDKKPISFFAAWCIPGVAVYSICFALVKGVNYGLFFWLPVYLHNGFDMSTTDAGFYSMLFDVGQIFGGFVAGYITDRMGVRSPIVAFMLLASSGIIYFFKGASIAGIAMLLLVSGMLLGGPSNLISACIAADLGHHPSLKGNSKALSTVAGIIDGTGSAGAALIQYLIGFLADCKTEGDDDDAETECQWDPVFLLLIFSTLASVACLLRIVYHEMHEYLGKGRQYSLLEGK